MQTQTLMLGVSIKKIQLIWEPQHSFHHHGVLKHSIHLCLVAIDPKKSIKKKS
jgi:hypothetical protein